MIQVDIPGKGTMSFNTLVLDYNGTLAIDGIMSDSVKNIILQLAPKLDIHIITADTFGTVKGQCQGLPVKLKILKSEDHTREKAEYLLNFDPQQIIAIGNGTNDRLMLERASLGIAVIGCEGASLKALLAADLVVNSIEDAFGLLLETQRLKATLRH